MRITFTNRELTSKELYFLCTSPDIRRMSEIAGETVEISAVVIYDKDNTDGSTSEILSLMTKEGEAYATNSKTFIQTFRDIIGCFAPDEIHKIEVSQGVSRSNRKFLTARYVD